MQSGGTPQRHKRESGGEKMDREQTTIRLPRELKEQLQAEAT